MFHLGSLQVNKRFFFHFCFSFMPNSTSTQYPYEMGRTNIITCDKKDFLNICLLISDVIIQGLKEAITQFKRQSQSLRQVRNNCRKDLRLSFLRLNIKKIPLYLHSPVFFQNIDCGS